MYDKNDVIYSDGIGVCKVADIVNLTVNKKPPMQYYLLSSVFNKKRTSYIPVNGHQVMLRRLITADEANEKAFMENITENEKNEIKYVLGRI
ncbi:MAG: hypothetical protein IJZ53_05925 [Tyzzerella sp.]|nr:hypothetical protein [Tyzzerella sp.]